MHPLLNQDFSKIFLTPSLFFEEICLVDQGFVKENKMKVSKYVESKNMKILSFVRYEVGEGMEKREENFADEVAKQING